MQQLVLRKVRHAALGGPGLSLVALELVTVLGELSNRR